MTLFDQVIQCISEHVPSQALVVSESTTLSELQLSPEHIAGSVTLWRAIETQFGVYPSPRDTRKLVTVFDAAAYVCEQKRLRSIGEVRDTSAAAARAMNLFTHYSTVRASLVASLLTVSFGFATYLLKYMADNHTSITTANRWISIYLCLVQLCFYMAATITSIKLATLQTVTRKALISMEGGEDVRLIQTLELRNFRYRPQDFWDWALLVGLPVVQVGVGTSLWLFIR